MKIRTQVQFEEEQYRALKDESRRLGLPLSEILRRIVARHFGTSRQAGGPRELPAFVGMGRDSASNVAERHDDYLADL